jgi:phospholipid-transporting ATPase
LFFCADLLGATAIEDKLQDGVPECVAELMRAGLHVWMLTGDKEETAINIAVACNLVQPQEFMKHIIINKQTCPDAQSLLTRLQEELSVIESEELQQAANSNRRSKFSSANGSSSNNSNHNSTNVSNPSRSKPRALVIDGPSLLTVNNGNNESCKHVLLQLSQRCQAVVACRVSPDQKREMVKLIKQGVPMNEHGMAVRTLAIGDGANDVAMIQEAHIGVGIRGEEGVQAVNASDYAIAQFRYLSILLLTHGRYNYIRMCYLICYMFYKNILQSMGQFWFNFYCGFSGQKYYTEGAIQLFNLLYTSLPILFFAVYDIDVKDVYVHKLYPQIYQFCVQCGYFNVSVPISSMFTA